MVDFAPLNVPLNRRLQTAAVLQWVFSFLGLGKRTLDWKCANIYICSKNGKMAFMLLYLWVTTLHVRTAATHYISTMNCTVKINGKIILSEHVWQTKRGRQSPNLKSIFFLSTDMHLPVLLLAVHTLLGDQRALLCLVVFRLWHSLPGWPQGALLVQTQNMGGHARLLSCQGETTLKHLSLMFHCVLYALSTVCTVYCILSSLSNNMNSWLICELWLDLHQQSSRLPVRQTVYSS